MVDRNNLILHYIIDNLAASLVRGGCFNDLPEEGHIDVSLIVDHDLLQRCLVFTASVRDRYAQYIVDDREARVIFQNCHIPTAEMRRALTTALIEQFRCDRERTATRTHYELVRDNPNLALLGPPELGAALRDRIEMIQRRLADDAIREFVYTYNAPRDEWVRGANEREKALTTARATLMEHLSPVQLREFEKNTCFHVTGNETGKTYRINRASSSNVYELVAGPGSQVRKRWCFVDSGHQIPVYDLMLMQKLCLETDESASMAVAIDQTRDWDTGMLGHMADAFAYGIDIERERRERERAQHQARTVEAPRIRPRPNWRLWNE